MLRLLAVAIQYSQQNSTNHSSEYMKVGELNVVPCMSTANQCVGIRFQALAGLGL